MNDTQANYMGRIIGHAGSTQKLIEQRSGCKIAIRGRGANNIHKDIYENFERLHVLITADTE
jgi:splicing factor 1